MGGDRRHDRAAIGRVHELHGVAEMRVRLLGGGQREQALAPLGVGVVEQRLMRPGGGRRRWRGRGACCGRSGAGCRRRGAVSLCDGCVEALGEGGVVEAHGRDIQAVEPDHRPAAVVAVVVPLPVGREHQVAGRHHRALAIDRGEGAVALHDEAERALRVAVGGRDLAGEDELEAGVEARRDGGGARHARILQDQHAALGLLGADQVAGAEQQVARRARRASDAPAPAERGVGVTRAWSTSQSGWRPCGRISA